MKGRQAGATLGSKRQQRRGSGREYVGEEYEWDPWWTEALLLPLWAGKPPTTEKEEATGTDKVG